MTGVTGAPPRGKPCGLKWFATSKPPAIQQDCESESESQDLESEKQHLKNKIQQLKDMIKSIEEMEEDRKKQYDILLSQLLGAAEHGKDSV